MSTYEVGRKPDFILSALNKANEARGRIGCGWKNEDGSISIKLNVFVQLPSDPDLVLTLFPNTPKETK